MDLIDRQPEERTEERAETHACDLISRKAAIDARCNKCYDTDGEICDRDDVCGNVMLLRNLPSAQPEYYDYSDINDVWEYYAEEQDIKLTDSAKQLKDAMWVGYQKGKQDAQSEQRWIPCSERLPVIKEHHVSEPCIVYCSNGAYGFAGLEENIFGQVGWNCERGDEYHEPLGEVLAWMPLPEPYRGERKTNAAE